MRTLLFITTGLAVMGLAFWAYQENYRTQEALKEVRKLQNEIAQNRMRLSVLSSEWAYLNRPDRLRDLAEVNFDLLGLLPMEPTQFGQVDQVSFPPADALPPITGAVDTMATDTGAAQ